MDKQEAIERIKQNKAAAEFYAQMIGNYRSVENELKDIEAFNMAIEALSKCAKGGDAEIPSTEQYPYMKQSPNSGADLIRRADVLALAEKGYIISNSNYKKVCDLINELPAMQK